ncbi:hypothetical protein Y032_0431g1341 [Ancylostoma ceylanicum]|uniref:Uncharacterized protein n=1 Tax=Ancylostoma ceylanicum TaxID=53326 RepID=A0A016X0J0_9BILA|nr:hypothetical protein Y032_0431g1341 [Ancylostoma ceylanicum]
MSHAARYGSSSLVMAGHSSLRFIFGFLLWIKNTSRVLRAEISLSSARIVTCTSKSTLLWAYSTRVVELRKPWDEDR